MADVYFFRELTNGQTVGAIVYFPKLKSAIIYRNQRWRAIVRGKDDVDKEFISFLEYVVDNSKVDKQNEYSSIVKDTKEYFNRLSRKTEFSN